MTNEMMNVEKIIKGAERMILRSMSIKVISRHINR